MLKNSHLKGSIMALLKEICFLFALIFLLYWIIFTIPETNSKAFIYQYF